MQGVDNIQEFKVPFKEGIKTVQTLEFDENQIVIDATFMGVNVHAEICIGNLHDEQNSDELVVTLFN